MRDEHNVEEGRCPQPGDIVLYGRSTDGKGAVSEVPAIILTVLGTRQADSRVDLKTFEIGHDMEAHRDVGFTLAPKQGGWRWRPDR